MRMAKDRGLWIERDGDMLTVRAENGITRWLGALFLGVGLGLVIAAANTHTGQVSRPWIVFFCGAFSVGCGVFLIVPRVHTTIFDSRSRQIVYTTSIWNRAPHTGLYAFEEITGLVLNKSIGISHCSPYLELKERGRRLLLSPNSGFVSVSAGVDLMEAICAATGLPVLDLDSWWS
jgi:hypothetical protein